MHEVVFYSIHIQCKRLGICHTKYWWKQIILFAPIFSLNTLYVRLYLVHYILENLSEFEFQVWFSNKNITNMRFDDCSGTITDQDVPPDLNVCVSEPVCLQHCLFQSQSRLLQEFFEIIDTLLESALGFWTVIHVTLKDTCPQ